MDGSEETNYKFQYLTPYRFVDDEDKKSYYYITSVYIL